MIENISGKIAARIVDYVENCDTAALISLAIYLFGKDAATDVIELQKEINGDD
jgi:hypothetical protein